MPRPLRFEERLKRYSPIMVRLVAVRGPRHNRWMPDDQQLADACGFTIAQFLGISYSLTWDDIQTALMFRYLKGCDVDLEDRDTLHRLEHMRKNGLFVHLQRSPEWETKYRAMIAMLP